MTRLATPAALAAALMLAASGAAFAQAASREAAIIAQTGATPDEVAAFKAADRDRDAALDRREFERFIAHRAGQGASTAQTIHLFGAYDVAFSRVDSDRDGLAEPMELKAADDAYEGEQSFSPAGAPN